MASNGILLDTFNDSGTNVAANQNLDFIAFFGTEQGCRGWGPMVDDSTRRV